MRKVLVVDDEPHIRAVLRGYLEADGFEVAEVGDGEAAIVALRAIPPDVVLLDVMLPGIDGLEVLRQLRMFSDASSSSSRRVRRRSTSSSDSASAPTTTSPSRSAHARSLPGSGLSCEGVVAPNRTTMPRCVSRM